MAYKCLKIAVFSGTFCKYHPIDTASDTALGLSYHHINQKFKKAFGYTVKQYHKRLRMHYAAELIQSGIPLQQVAEQCGYEDYYFFTSSFKKEYGITPSMFRILHGM